MTCRKNVNSAHRAGEARLHYRREGHEGEQRNYSQYVRHMDAMNHATPASGSSPLTRNAATADRHSCPGTANSCATLRAGPTGQVPGAILPYWDWASDAGSPTTRHRMGRGLDGRQRRCRRR